MTSITSIYSSAYVT